MPQRTAMIDSLPEAFGMVKTMRADGSDWAPVADRRCADPRPRSFKAGWRRMSTVGSATPKAATDATATTEPARAARRANWVTSGRRCCTADATALPPYRRAGQLCAPHPGIDLVILIGFVPGPSIRRIGEVLLPPLGQPVPPATVSRVAGTLDAAIAAFHRHPLANRYKVLMLDGVVPARRSGTGAVRHLVPVAPAFSPTGVRGSSISNLPAEKAPPNGSACSSPSTGESLEMICVDSGNGLPAALPPVHREIAHFTKRRPGTGTKASPMDLSCRTILLIRSIATIIVMQTLFYLSIAMNSLVNKIPKVWRYWNTMMATCQNNQWP